MFMPCLRDQKRVSDSPRARVTDSYEPTLGWGWG